MNALDELSIKYPTDKNYKTHNYFRYYDKYFSSMREQTKCLLEIGVYNGNSLKIWNEYFENSFIVGIDINKDCSVNTKGRINVFIGNQSDPVFLNSVIEKTCLPDVIIDDGSHKGIDQIITFKTLFPYLKSGGYYVVEDTCTAYWWKNNFQFIDMIKSMVDNIHFHGKRFNGTGCQNNEVLRTMSGLNDIEKSVESIIIHNSLIFIKKY